MDAVDGWWYRAISLRPAHDRRVLAKVDRATNLTQQAYPKPTGSACASQLATTAAGAWNDKVPALSDRDFAQSGGGRN